MTPPFLGPGCDEVQSHKPAVFGGRANTSPTGLPATVNSRQQLPELHRCIIDVPGSDLPAARKP